MHDRMTRNKGFRGFMDYICFILAVQLFLQPSSSKRIPGHLEKLGSHREPFGVTLNGIFSKPIIFYRHFIRPGKPLLMKDVLNLVNHPGLTTWTDEYLKEQFGSEIVTVETGKVEDRKRKASHKSLRDFLGIYKKQDVYMVHSLSGNMKDLVFIPETLQCGGFQNVLQDAVMWLGSGVTSSVLHRDPLDNFLCLLDGEKDIVLIDKAYREKVESRGFEKQGYSHVDPLSVDMEAFPNFRDLIWHQAQLKKGDCLYIPENWYHQVTSRGTRHMSINIWLAHLNWFDRMNCSDIQTLYRILEPIATFGFASPNEIHRSNLLRRFKGKGILTQELFHELLPNNPTKERSDAFFESINEFQDPILTWGELHSFDIDQMLMKFPDLFDLSGEPYIDDSEDKERINVSSEDFTREQDEISEKRTRSGSRDSDSAVPLPDALSDDDVLLPDDPAGQTLYHTNEDDDNDGLQKDKDTTASIRTHSTDGMYTKNKSSQQQKDEL